MHDEPTFPLLWAIHVAGPDDWVAAQSFDLACAEAKAINKSSDMMNKRMEPSEPVLCAAQVKLWPFARTDHAKDLAKLVSDYSSPTPNEVER